MPNFLQNYIFSSYFVFSSIDKAEIPALLHQSDHDIDADMQLLHFYSFAEALPSRSMRLGIMGGQFPAPGQVATSPYPLGSPGSPETPWVSLASLILPWFP